MRIMISALILSFTSGVYAQNTDDSGWQANSEIVSEQVKQRPEYIWQESNVPTYQLPDPLKSDDGSPIRTPEQWKERRSEILALFRTHMYGHRPGRPDQLSFEIINEDSTAMDGNATLRQVMIRSAHQGRSHEFEVNLFLPNKTTEPVPVFLLMNNRDPENTDPARQHQSGFWPAEEVIARGYGIAAIQNEDLAPDNPDRYHEGVIRLFEGETVDERSPDAWMALSAWGWGASRVMDYFETDPRVDASKTAIIGHSRGGKASLWAGAEDERFAIVISNNSGSGGAALSRRTFGETLRAVNGFTHWFAGNLESFEDREEELPFDQHMLIGLIAPRAVYIASADDDLWADPRGEFLSLAHASPVYALWDHNTIHPEKMPAIDQPFFAGPMGYHVRTGRHNLTPVDWNHFMDFADRIYSNR